MSEVIATGRRTRRRIWSEFVEYEELCSIRVVRLLREHDLEVLVAVTPPQLEDVPQLVRRLRNEGISLGLWPMVDDADGRWGSTFNARVFSDFALRVAKRAPEGATIAVDLEPPISMMHGLLSGKPSAYRSLFRSESWAPGHDTLQDLLATLAGRGNPCIAAANPMLLGDGRGESAWQWLFGTPIDALPFDAVSFMTYTSLIEGYSRGLIDRDIAHSMLMHTATAARVQWGPRASLSIGTVGGGALGTEKPYRSIEELREDVETALACGIEDIALFDLAGVLAKENPARWIETFANTPPAPQIPRSRRRARILKAGIKRSGAAIGWYRKYRGY